MRNRSAVALAALSLALLASPAYAHHAEWMHDAPFLQGLSMPIHGLDHLLVAFAVGLVAARIGGAAVVAMPAVFALFVTIGGLLNVRGIAVPFVEPAILASSLVLGAVLVARRALPPVGATLLVGVLAIFQGSALVSEPAGVPLSVVAWFTAGCLTSALAVIGLGVAAGFAAQRTLRQAQGEREQPVALRFAGATIAALGVVAYLIPAANGFIIHLLE